MGLSAEHKRKISEGMKAYHRTCGKKARKQTEARKKLDEERKKLKKMIEPKGGRVKKAVAKIEKKMVEKKK